MKCSHTIEARARLTPPLPVMAALALGMTTACGGQPLAFLESPELLIHSSQRILDEEPRRADGQPRLYSRLDVSIVVDHPEEECPTLPLGSTATFRGALVDLDAGGPRVGGGIGLSIRNYCQAPSVELEGLNSHSFDDEDELEVTISDGIDTWATTFRNPFRMRRLERLDDDVLVAGSEVTYRWSEEGERPLFRDYRGDSEQTAKTMLRAERRGQTGIDVPAEWNREELTLELPEELTGEAEIFIDHRTYAESGSVRSWGSQGASLVIKGKADECPVERCAMDIDVALEPLFLNVEAPAD